MTPDPKTEALKPCPNHSRYTEGCTACFVETGTSAPAIDRDAELAALREQLAEATKKQPINTSLRLFDLVRYLRSDLHQAELITDEEYTQLCMGPMAISRKGGSPSRQRLEDYDEIRAKLTAAESDLDEARAKLKATEKELFDSKIVSRNRFDALMTAHEQRDGWKARATAAEAASATLVKANPPIGKGSMGEC